MRPLDIETVFDYSQSIKRLVKTYFHASQPNEGDWSEVEKEKLSQINRQGNGDIFKLCVAVLHMFEKGTAREILLSAIERFGFLTKLRSYYFDVSITELTGKVFAEKLEIEDLTKALTEPSDKFAKSKDFHDSIRTLGKNLNSGYYSWKQLRYFMFEYEQHLRQASKTTRQLLKWSDDVSREHYNKDHKTIEHIYPQKASSSYWTQAINGRGYSIKERNMLKNSIGNLLPVSHAKNASLSNKSFEEKKGSESNQVGYRYGCLSEIQVSACKEWTGIEILRRGIYLLDFLERRWSLKIGDASRKADVLGLKFVLSYEHTDINAVVNQKIPVPSVPDERIEDRADQIEF
jgi:hypothetical protein